jgi:hypothetical protein
MMSTNNILEQGIAALKAGQKAEARHLLEQVVQQDKDNETAWLWLSGAVDTDSDRIHCLRETLRINPNNQHARRGLEILESKAPTPRPAQPVERKPTRPPPTTAEPIQVVEGPSPDDTKQCPYCAETIKAEAKFCRFCGRNLEASELPQQLQSQSQQPKTVVQQAAPPRKKRNPVITCLAALGLIAVVFICLAVLISPSSTTTLPATKTPIAPRYTRTPSYKLELLSDRGTLDEYFATVEGQVKNISGQSLDSVLVVVSWYDASGGFITSDWSFIDYQPILAGQTSPFKVMTTKNPAMKKFSINFKEFAGGTIPYKDSSN